ncbi:MAG: hypothetical protein SGILL_009915 [Bacillariaceae sp.]
MDDVTSSTTFSEYPSSPIQSPNNSHNDNNDNGYSDVHFSSGEEYDRNILHSKRKNNDGNGYSNFTIDDDGDDYDDDEFRMAAGDTFDLEHADDEQQEQQQQHPLQSMEAPLSVYSASASVSPTSFAGNTNSNNPPANYRCPLTLQLMEDPVNDGCGHCFERRAIQDWLEYRDVCPISRKPLDYQQDLFTNGALKARILEWKEDHPLYQQCDPQYAQHEFRDVLGYHDYDDDSNDHDGEDEEATCQQTQSQLQDPHSQFELMLLPQERQVLNIVKARAFDRRKRYEWNRCMWSIAITCVVFVVGGAVLIWVMMRNGLKRPF